MTRELLSTEDTRILALESGNIRGHTCKLIVFAGVRSAAEVRAQLEERLGAVPQLTRQLDPDANPPAWIDDPTFSLDRHVIDRGALDDAGLRRLVATAMETPLDRRRPLWAMDVVSPLAGVRTAIVWRIHHAVADGMTAMRMASVLLLDAAEDGSHGRQPSHPRASPLRLVASLPKTLRQAVGRRASLSPLACDAGPHREVAFVDAPLEVLHRVGHAAPVPATVNDVALSAVGAGLRAWLQKVGAPLTGVRAKVPVSLHQPDEADTANRDSFIFVDLPVEQRDPLERLAAITRETRGSKTRHDAETLNAFFRGLGRLSPSLDRRAEHWAMSPRIFTLNVSNVPGPRGPQLVLGAPLLELHSLAEIAHRHVLRVAIVSAGGRISFGLCADADAVGRIDLIADGIRQELDALDALLLSAPKSGHRRGPVPSAAGPGGPGEAGGGGRRT
jgi:Wax ester synthase/diacylglycerol acyltransferase catalytic domain/WS/DGAT C-terminal domain